MNDGLKLQFTLVGKTRKNITTNNKEVFENVKNIIGSHFGGRPLYFVDSVDSSTEILTYPPYFSAGWYTGYKDGLLSELVLVAHGKTMESATQSMLKSAERLNLKAYVSDA